MADELGPDPSTPGDGTAEAAAVHVAMRSVEDTEDARTFLREQTNLVRLQARQLQAEEKLHHWSLRFRHTNELLTLAFRLSLGALALILVGVLATLIWNASRDESLIVQAFSVPPDMANSGLNGQTVAGMLLDRLQAMQAQSAGVRADASFTNDWSDTAKIEIPQVGFSLDQLLRFLRATFGHPTTVGGEVFRSGKTVAVNLRLGSRPGESFGGAESNFNGTLQRSAEFIYAQLQPTRYITYLQNQGRIDEATRVAEAVAERGAFAERPWAYIALEIIRFDQGDLKGGEAAARAAINLNPNLAWTYQRLMRGERLFGREEAVLSAIIQARRLAAAGAPEITPVARALIDSGNFELSTCDYSGAVAAVERFAKVNGTSPLASPAFSSLLAYYNLQRHDIASAQRLLSGVTDDREALRNFKQYYAYTGAIAELAVEREDWATAIAQFSLAEPELAAQGPPGVLVLQNLLWPYKAYAEAHAGNFRAADELLKKTRVDCYRCLLNRALVDDVRQDQAGAERWFKEAIHQGPSIPLAYAAYGRWLLSQGRTNDAIAQLQLAHVKGPRFADPLEFWGEALVASNRSDLSLVKFQEASQYAPNWGRLHLKWGEALLWLGRKDDARKQFDVASSLFLTARDRSELARVRAI